MRIRSAVITAVAAAGAAALVPQPAAASGSSPVVSSLTDSKAVELLRIPLSERNVELALDAVETVARPLNMEKGASFTGR
ncbi:hypothetical protein ADK86_33430 [Streptomyces sp. NRRL F-5755]|uniref:hypothetical protein n=1 Tax=Streptomyces sp. NRRL F-5755 TaxID=1519475 RepID=UPI0006AE0B16|nr:hypothetical protein [Streptomyces sp. NRRL F-5755]KOT88144.1 hypothetical protein ADK86_33430 [Streptomyces sp. NRRL F-5755]KWT59715.1 hypothetical protein ADL21_22860 [Streptomyces albus subsp. albus]